MIDDDDPLLFTNIVSSNSQKVVSFFIEDVQATSALINNQMAEIYFQSVGRYLVICYQTVILPF